MSDTTTIRVKLLTKDALDELVVKRSDTYDDIIQRLLVELKRLREAEKK